MESDNFIRKAALLRVIDGDTYVFQVDLGYYVSSAVRVRLHGIDVFEADTPMGRAVKEFCQGLLEDAAQTITIKSYKDQMSFNRWVCDVWVNNVLLADLLRANGYEKPAGGK